MQYGCFLWYSDIVYDALGHTIFMRYSCFFIGSKLSFYMIAVDVVYTLKLQLIGLNDMRR